MNEEPFRILELRSVRGVGGGPEKTILQGASRSDPARFAVTVCYLRDRRDAEFSIHRDADRLNVDYAEVTEAHSFDWRVLGRLRALVRSRRIEVVHAHEYKTDLLALMLARTEHVIPLATVHGWTGHSLRERWLYYPADKRLLRRFPRLIAVSAEISRELVRRGVRTENVSVILNGIDHRAFVRQPDRRQHVRHQLGLASDAILIGSVGRAEPQKRFDLLVDVFASLWAKRPHLRLVVAGEGGLRGQLERQAQGLGVGAVCRFLGHRRDIADLHSAFDLFVQSSDYEGTPNSVLEAMACETPIVATDVGGTREVARPDIDALIVPPRDVVALRQAVENCLDDAGAARRRVVAARARIESDLSFDARMAKVEEICAGLAGARRRTCTATERVPETISHRA